MLNAKSKYEIHDRVYQFAFRVLRAVSKLPRTTENVVLIKQVVRSATSIGANTSEADGAESKKEFIQQFTIAKKEAKETLYWLTLLFAYNNIPSTKSQALLNENEQIILVLSKIILNAKK